MCHHRSHVRGRRARPQLPPATLLRESYREDGKVKNRTLANLSVGTKIDLRPSQGRGRALPLSAFDNVRSLPYGHVAATLGSLRRIGLESILASRRSRPRRMLL